MKAVSVGIDAGSVIYDDVQSKLAHCHNLPATYVILVSVQFLPLPELSAELPLRWYSSCVVAVPAHRYSQYVILLSCK